MMTSVPNSLNFIPQDLIIEILLKLPAKSLFKFQLVSKTWCSIIRDQRFRDRFMSRPRLLFAFKRIEDDQNQLIFFSSAHHSQESNDSSSIKAEHEMTILKAYKVHGTSVRGLICCSHNFKYMVCNPTTGQVIYLPEVIDSFHHNTKKYMYLGYDSSNDLYKVLCMITETSGHFFHGTFEKYSLHTLGSTQSSSFPWRPVESGIASHQIPSYNSVYIDGVVYFQVKFRNFSKEIIMVRFDFVSECFDQIKMPKETLIHLSNYQGKLGGFSYLRDDSCSLWVLDDVKNQIWSNKIYVLPQSVLSPKLSFSGTTNAGELVFMTKSFFSGFCVFFYDLQKNITRRIKFEGVTNNDEFRCSSKNIYFLSMSCDHVEIIVRF